MIKKQLIISPADFKAGRMVNRNGRLTWIPGRSVSLKKHRVKTILPPELIKETYDFYLSVGGIYIPYNVISSKNSMQFAYVGKPGNKFPKLLHSEAYQYYVKLTSPHWAAAKKDFLELVQGKGKPVVIEFYFIRKDKGAFDYINMLQGPQDLLVKHGFLPSDNCFELFPVFRGHCVDPDRQGIVMFIK